MKAKIFTKLKQEYASLGLGDEILQGRAESLAKTGLVTDENIDYIVSVQKAELEQLQRLNDTRVNNALEKQRQKFEEEAKKKEADAKAEADRKAAEESEAKRKADEEAEAKKKADEEAEAKAKAEAEAKKAAEEEEARLAEMAKKNELPEEFLNTYKENLRKAEENSKALKTMLEQMQKAQADSDKQYQEIIKSLQTSNETFKSNFDQLQAEKDANIKAQEVAKRAAFIEEQAKKLGIPQWRVDEGFRISDTATDDEITEALSKVSSNISTQLLPEKQPAFKLSGSEPTKEEIADFAKTIVK
jgi:hypothetical protein